MPKENPLNSDAVTRFRTIDLFAGIGGIRLGFESIGCETVFASEIDPQARQVYASNFGGEPYGDIHTIEPYNIPDHDILLAGFPCQAFSIAGKGLGFEDTRGTLFFTIEQILKEKMPSAFFLENVKRLKSHDGGNTFSVIEEKLTELGYTIYYDVLNTLDYGLPQKRERIYIVGFKEKIGFAFPKPLGKYVALEHILEPESNVEKSYFLSERMRVKRHNSLKKTPIYPSIWHENIGGNISPLPFSCALRAGGSYNYLVVNGKRRLTSREMLRLQGFPDSFKIEAPYSQVRKFAGNSVSVPVVKLIAEQMLHSLQTKPKFFGNHRQSSIEYTNVQPKQIRCKESA